jgi:hypothetical protein
MLPLKERQAARAAARANPDAWRLPSGEVGEGQDTESGEGEKDQFDALTVPQLKEWAASLDSPVPAEKTKREDVLAYVRNLQTYLLANGGKAPTPGWTSNN